jgi:hypothetical protein
MALESAERRSGLRLQGLKRLECEKSLDVVNPRCGISRKEKVSHGRLPHVEPPPLFPRSCLTKQIPSERNCQRHSYKYSHLLSLARISTLFFKSSSTPKPCRDSDSAARSRRGNMHRQAVRIRQRRPRTDSIKCGGTTSIRRYFPPRRGR